MPRGSAERRRRVRARRTGRHEGRVLRPAQGSRSSGSVGRSRPRAAPPRRPSTGRFATRVGGRCGFPLPELRRGGRRRAAGAAPRYRRPHRGPAHPWLPGGSGRPEPRSLVHLSPFPQGAGLAGAAGERAARDPLRGGRGVARGEAARGPLEHRARGGGGGHPARGRNPRAQSRRRGGSAGGRGGGVADHRGSPLSRSPRGFSGRRPTRVGVGGLRVASRFGRAVRIARRRRGARRAGSIRRARVGRTRVGRTPLRGSGRRAVAALRRHDARRPQAHLLRGACGCARTSRPRRGALASPGGGGRPGAARGGSGSRAPVASRAGHLHGPGRSRGARRPLRGRGSLRVAGGRGAVGDGDARSPGAWPPGDLGPHPRGAGPRWRRRDRAPGSRGRCRRVRASRAGSAPSARAAPEDGGRRPRPGRPRARFRGGVGSDRNTGRIARAEATGGGGIGSFASGTPAPTSGAGSAPSLPATPAPTSGAIRQRAPMRADGA